MQDLSKAYGIYEGVVFYGDHQNENVIYYFPNEIKMAKRTDDNNKYELGLQLFYENKMVERLPVQVWMIQQVLTSV